MGLSAPQGTAGGLDGSIVITGFWSGGVGGFLTVGLITAIGRGLCIGGLTLFLSSCGHGLKSSLILNVGLPWTPRPGGGALLLSGRILSSAGASCSLGVGEGDMLCSVLGDFLALVGVAALDWSVVSDWIEVGEVGVYCLRLGLLVSCLDGPWLECGSVERGEVGLEVDRTGLVDTMVSVASTLEAVRLEREWAERGEVKSVLVRAGEVEEMSSVV